MFKDSIRFSMTEESKQDLTMNAGNLLSPSCFNLRIRVRYPRNYSGVIPVCLLATCWTAAWSCGVQLHAVVRLNYKMSTFQLTLSYIKTLKVCGIEKAK